MKSTTVLQFQSLSDLARYVKTLPMTTYLINTQHLTIKAPLKEFDISIAVEQYGANILRQTVEA